MKKWKVCLLVVVFVSFLFSTSCSIKKMAMNSVADSLTGPGSSTVFTGDNDPELVGDALPFTIKMYESLMVSLPRHMGLRLQTGSLYIMYANAFIQYPADMLPDEQLDEQEFMWGRAKNLYLRGRDIILKGLEIKHPGFRKHLDAREFDKAFAPTTIGDIDLLYWGAAGWLGAYAIEPLDTEMGMSVPKAAAMMERVLKLDPGYNSGAIHDFYITYYGSLPDYMGGDRDKAREHYTKALEAAGENATTPHLSLATTVCVDEQKVKEFRELLNKVIAADPDAEPENRLVNTLNQRKAKWLLEHIEDLFLEVE